MLGNVGAHDARLVSMLFALNQPMMSTRSMLNMLCKEQREIGLGWLRGDPSAHTNKQKSLFSHLSLDFANFHGFVKQFFLPSHISPIDVRHRKKNICLTKQKKTVFLFDSHKKNVSQTKKMFASPALSGGSLTLFAVFFLDRRFLQ